MSTRDTLRDDSIACACTGLTVNQVRGLMAEKPGLDFDKLQDETGAGRKCTACLLDLELLYVDLSQRAAHPALKKADAAAVPDQPKSLKRRLYDLLDAIPILVPVHEPNFMPLIHGPGISSRLWLANFSLLYKGSPTPPDFAVNIRVRDSRGRVVLSEQRRLDTQTEIRLDASNVLPASESGETYSQRGISFGSIEVDRIADAPGVRGTTRPQVEFISPGSFSSLHTQGLGKTMNRRFSCYYRPDVERVFFTVISDAEEPRPVTLNVHEYTAQGPGPLLHTYEAIVSPRGTVALPLELDAGVQLPPDTILECHIQGAMGGKVHAACCAPDFSLLAFDHI
jgi:bacterioferritin-associated ferredoxin